MVDLHIHTTFSDGSADYKTIIDLAVDKGLETIAITDHYDPCDSGLQNRAVTEEELAAHFSNIRAYAAGKPIRVLCGIETGAGPDGRMRISKSVRESCQLIITSPHYVFYEGALQPGELFNDGYWEAYKRQTLAIAGGDGDILGHPEAYLPRKALLPLGATYTFEEGLALCAEIAQHYFDAPYIDALGDALAASGKACELHGGSSTPREWVIERLAGKGVSFSIGSDTHLTSFLGRTAWAYEMAEKHCLKLKQWG